MKAKLKRILSRPWFWVPMLFIVYGVLFFGSDHYFDWSEKQWLASLTDGERVGLYETWTGLAKIQNDGATWPTFVEFKDGKVGLVYTDDNHSDRGMLLVNGKPEVVLAILRSHREMFRVARIVYPGDPLHEEEKKKFFR